MNPADKLTREARIGLALSGGAARGLAHIPALEAFDEVGIRPAAIAGASIGAVMGAAYAAGMTGRDIREYAVGLFDNPGDVVARLWRLRPTRMRDLFTEGGLTVGQFDPEAVLRTFLPRAVPDDFAGLGIPLTVIATDFYRWREMPLASGPLIAAIAASVALPLAFRPVVLDGTAMVDG